MCETAHKWALALHLFSKMGLAGVPWTTVTFGAAISACDKSLDWPLALQLGSQSSLCEAALE